MYVESVNLVGYVVYVNEVEFLKDHNDDLELKIIHTHRVIISEF